MAPTAVRKLRNGFAMAPTSQYLCWRQQNERKDLWIGAARARDDSTAAAPPRLALGLPRTRRRCRHNAKGTGDLHTNQAAVCGRFGVGFRIKQGR